MDNGLIELLSVKISYLSVLLISLLIIVALITARSYFQRQNVASKNQTSRSWPEIPFRLIHNTGIHKRPEIPRSHYAIHNARIMALTHNTMFRSLNAIYQQAPSVRLGSQDAKNLLHYCQVVYNFIHDHHTIEEVCYFPGIEKATGIKGLMAENLAQHEKLHAGLEELHTYATSTSIEKFDATNLRSILDRLVEPLETHLHDEIPSILDLWDKIESETLRKVYQKMHDAAEKQANAWETGPFVLGCQDNTFLLDGEKIPFPELPSQIIVYIVDQILARRYSSMWRLNPSTIYGIPRASKFS